jgi:hypothetical protein
MNLSGMMEQNCDYLLGKITLSPEEQELNDFNNDGFIDISDIVSIINKR